MPIVNIIKKEHIKEHNEHVKNRYFGMYNYKT